MQCYKTFVFILLLGLFLLFLQALNKKNPVAKILFSTTNNFDRAVQLISRIRSNDASINGLPYRSVLCTIVRNDPHIVEFILRHLISGFSHIVIYDNNRVKAGYDLNMTNVLQPFIAAGVVTHIPWFQESIELLYDDERNDNNDQCIQKYGLQADWVGLFETDEFFYYEKENKSVNTLNDLLMKLEQQSVCGIGIAWTMMYGEGRMLKSNKTLFETFPRICNTVGQQKVLARAQITKFDVPHLFKCKWSNYTANAREFDETSKPVLVHYYSKSVQEFLVKGDQSTPPSIRMPVHSYRASGSICNRKNFSYSDDYVHTFMDVYNELKLLHSIEPIALLPIPALNIRQTPSVDHTEYALFMYFKYRVAMGQDFDDERYLSINPRAKQAIDNGTVTDALHHFMLHFANGAKSCWKTGNHSTCS